VPTKASLKKRKLAQTAADYNEWPLIYRRQNHFATLATKKKLSFLKIALHVVDWLEFIEEMPTKNRFA